MKSFLVKQLMKKLMKSSFFQQLIVISSTLFPSLIILSLQRSMTVNKYLNLYTYN